MLGPDDDTFLRDIGHSTGCTHHKQLAQGIVQVVPCLFVSVTYEYALVLFSCVCFRLLSFCVCILSVLFCSVALFPPYSVPPPSVLVSSPPLLLTLAVFPLCGLMAAVADTYVSPTPLVGGLCRSGTSVVSM